MCERGVKPENGWRKLRSLSLSPLYLRRRKLAARARIESAAADVRWAQLHLEEGQPRARREWRCVLGKRGGLSLENGKVTRPVSIRRGEMLSCTKVVRSANRVVASILSEKNGQRSDRKTWSITQKTIKVSSVREEMAVKENGIASPLYSASRAIYDSIKNRWRETSIPSPSPCHASLSRLPCQIFITQHCHRRTHLPTPNHFPTRHKQQRQK